MKKIFLILLGIFILNSHLSIAQSGDGEKTTCACWDEESAWVLIPNATDTRLGWLNSSSGLGAVGNYPNNAINSLGIPYYSICWNVSSTSGHVNNILNPSLLGGLPAHFPGLASLTGVARAPSTYPAFSFYLSTTMNIGGTNNHYLLLANEPSGAINFTVSSVVTVTASFAPASSGWKLSHIEADNSGILYGMFCNGTGTYLASINISTGVATSIHYWPTIAFNAMDVFIGCPSCSDVVYLINFASSTVYAYVISTGVVTTTTTSMSPTTGLFSLDEFFYADRYLGYLSFYLDGSSVPAVYRSPDATGAYTPTTYPNVTSTAYEMLDMSSIDWTTSTGFIINDISH